MPTIKFDDIYKYHIDKYKDLIEKEKVLAENCQQEIDNLKVILLNNATNFKEYYDFDIESHLINDKGISTKSLCKTNMVYQTKRYMRCKRYYSKNNEDVLSIILYLHNLLSTVYNNRLKQFEHTDNILLYESYLLDKKEFKEYYNLWRIKVEELLLNGKDVELPAGMGTIGIYRIANDYRENTRANSYISWGQTNNRKKVILNRGGVLYNKHDHQKAIERGEDYEGERYIVFKSDTFSYSFQWFKSKCSESSKYIFSLSSANNSTHKEGRMISVDEYYEKLKDKEPSINDLINLPIGIKSKLIMMLKIYPHYIINFVKDISHNKYLQELNNSFLSGELTKKSTWDIEKYKIK